MIQLIYKNKKENNKNEVKPKEEKGIIIKPILVGLNNIGIIFLWIQLCNV